ncbi:D-alanyl-D-alanine carboxypeptidase [Salinimicrobium sp. CDJ15-81-2]|nr:D-alanyl-D-alanine carboxypeptidase [Salinimicrobium nanhaiense]
MHYIFRTLIALLLLTSCSSSKVLTSQLDKTLEEFPAFKTGFAGIMVYDPVAKKVVFEHNSEKYFTPASNTKLFTFYAGVKILGDSAAGLEYVVKKDSLIFRGTGDPSFLYDKLESTAVLDFLKARNETLYYVPPVFREEHFGSGWSWDDYNYNYSVERAAMPIYGNYATFSSSSETEIPVAKPKYFSQLLLKDSLAAGNNFSVMRERDQNRFHYHQPAGAEKRNREVPFIYSPQLVIELLSDTLQKPVKLLNPERTDFSNSKILYSIPTDSLYKRMLQVSDNFIAEQLLLISSKVIADSLKTDIAIDYMQKNYLQDLPDEVIWVDGSGLSVYNKFTPRSVVRLLEKISEEVPQKRLFQLLPAGGESGTIKNLYKAEEPYIFAKTGTIRNVHALSGYLKTKSGKVLIFSFMNNNYTVPSAEIKAGMELILRNIYLNY